MMRDVVIVSGIRTPVGDIWRDSEIDARSSIRGFGVERDPEEGKFETRCNR